MKNRIGIPVLLFMLLPAAAAAQHQGHHEDQAPGAGNPAELGRVHFPVSCSDAARTQFDRAVAMLHSFWYEEAEKTFGQIAAADPRCAMAWWGIAMSLYHPIWPDPPPLDRGLAAVQKAKSIGAGTERERAYIGAIEAFYEGGDRDRKTRAIAYEKAMRRVSSAYPEDPEAAAFYAVALLWTLSVSPADQTNPRMAAAVLDRVASRLPDHPGVFHYYIHAYDSPALAPLALDAARRYAKVAPAVPHALHMPSHIFTRLGYWQDSIESNRSSAAAARDYEERTRMAGTWDQELHALDYLEYAYLQRGDDANAKAVLERARGVKGVEPVGLVAAYALAAVPVRYAVEGHRWAQALELELSPAGFPWKNFPVAEAMARYARALGAVHTGNLPAARKEIEALGPLRDGLKGLPGYDWSIFVETLRLEATGRLAYAEGRGEEALGLLRSATELEESTDKHAVTPGVIVPAREQLADLLLEVGRPGEALAEYEGSLKLAPNRFHALSGAARAARKAGQSGKAGKYYEKLIAQCDPSSPRQELVEAREFLAGIDAGAARSSMLNR